ncbi:hypothetical protein BDN71DRAFT_1483874 [Pleurotus eryngii]|uniref:Uncharacterized protein n=1 Tax=Pleurotus eryngii TaxID=5323 RepID=A0A9P5ZUT3_PLEER|nr:hypothetical protein BDN71DRAFT_1483874 [Pleurotus eryngii]
MYDTIDTSTQGNAPWNCLEVSYSDNVPENAAAWKKKTYKVWYRDPDVVLCNLLNNPNFNGEFDYASYMETVDLGKEDAMYTAIILGSDKTTVSVVTGQVEYHPLYMTIRNIYNNVQCAHRQGVVPIAFLAIPKSDRWYDNNPFTNDFPWADIHEIMVPDLLHQIIKGTFKDHLVTWVGEYLELEHGPTEAVRIMDMIDQQITATPGFPGLHRFPDGRHFKHSGVHKSISLPRQHLLVHYAHLIQEFGAPRGLCSSITKPWRCSSRWEALGQMLTTNQWLDKLAAMHTDFEEHKMISISRDTVLKQTPNLLDDEGYCPTIYSKITVFHSTIAMFFTPSDISGIHGMQCEHICSTPDWWGGDCLGFNGMSVVRIQFLFSFKHDGTTILCALVQWFKQYGQQPDANTGLWVDTAGLGGRSIKAEAKSRTLLSSALPRSPRIPVPPKQTSQEAP